MIPNWAEVRTWEGFTMSMRLTEQDKNLLLVVELSRKILCPYGVTDKIVEKLENWYSDEPEDYEDYEK